MNRVIYMDSFEEKVYVLHAFQKKKTQKVSKQDLDAVRRAFREIGLLSKICGLLEAWAGYVRPFHRRGSRLPCSTATTTTVEFSTR